MSTLVSARADQHSRFATCSQFPIKNETKRRNKKARIANLVVSYDGALSKAKELMVPDGEELQQNSPANLMECESINPSVKVKFHDQTEGILHQTLESVNSIGDIRTPILKPSTQTGRKAMEAISKVTKVLHSTATSMAGDWGNSQDSASLDPDQPDTTRPSIIASKKGR